MNAVIKPKINSRPRVELGKVAPIKIPFSIQIDICSACNMKCNFCFHSDAEAIAKGNCTFGMMSYELFVKIIEDIKQSWGVGSIKKLRLFKIGESLLNPNVCKMVKYAKDSGVAECVEITTNGTLLNKELSQGLIDAGLDILNISVNGIDEKQYAENCCYKMDYDEFINNIKYFYENKKGCRVQVKYSDIGYSEEQKQSFYNYYRSICDEMYVETISATLWQDTKINQVIENQRKGTYGQELDEKEICPFLFTTLVINHKGIAHLCCVDWKTEYILGDLKTENIADVWSGEKLKRYQVMHLMKKRRNIPICEKCESLSANTIDNIDSYADEILERINKD